VDYRKFLEKRELVLAYTGGLTVASKDRTLRLRKEIAPGFWRFEIKGRDATPIARAEPSSLGELGDLPHVRGHFASEWLFEIGRAPERVELLPEEEIAPLSIAIARRWFDGDLIFDAIDFDGDAEIAARAALEEGRGLGDVKGVPSSLRAAFAWATIARASRKEIIPCALAEMAYFSWEIAENGESAARDVLAAIDARRSPHRVRVGGTTFEVARTVERLRRAGREPTIADAPERAEKVLEAAGARFLSSRVLASDQMEVGFRFCGEHCVCIFFFKQKTAYEIIAGDWSSDVCSSDLGDGNQSARGDAHVATASQCRA